MNKNITIYVVQVKLNDTGWINLGNAFGTREEAEQYITEIKNNKYKEYEYRVEKWERSKIM